MAEAPNLTTSKVRLWDRLLSDYNVDSGDGLVLHPETELAAIVMATDDYIVSSGNSLTLNADSVWSGNISEHAASEYCPLSKVVDGNTQYAEMYVSNGSATVTEVPTSTGYGTLINALSTTTSVGPVSGASSATNDYIPTERAVALALEGKQQVLSGGACITLTPGANYTDISVNVQTDTPLPDLANATQDKVPTEYVVRHAIDVAGNACSSYAYGLVDALDASIHNAGYAASAWCLNTFLQKGESPEPTPGGDWSYATAESAGVVLPYSGCGLTVGASGSLTLAPATTSSIGGVVVGMGLEMVNTSKLQLKKAQVNEIGGVKVSAGEGLSLNTTDGYLKLSAAPVGTDAITYTSAVAKVGSNAIGGVYVMNHIESATAAAHKSKAIVPTVDAVWSAVDAAKCPHTFTSGLSEDSTTHVVTLDAASTDAIGGVYVPTGSGLAIDSADGKLTAVIATDAAAGVVKVGTGLGMSASVTGGSADTLYVTNAGGLASYSVSAGTGIDVAGISATGCTVGLSAAQSDTIGGVAIPTNKGLTLNNGSVTLSKAPVSATFDNASAALSAGRIGGVVVMMGDLGAAAGTWNTIAQDAPVVPNISAMKQYVGANYVSKTAYATSASAGIVKIGSGIDVVNGTISVAGDVDASYKGPFAVAADSDEEVVKVSSGYVKWLDGQLEVPASSAVSMPYNSFLYLTGSSGMIQGSTVTGSSYIIQGGGATWSRTESAAKNDRYKWKKLNVTGNTYTWIPDAVPSIGTPIYSTSATSVSGGTVTGVDEYAIQLDNSADKYVQIDQDPISGYQWNNDYFDTTLYRYSFTMGTTTFYRTTSAENGRYGWTQSGESGSTQQWTDSPTPAVGDTVYRYPTGTDTNGTIASIGSEVLFTGTVKRTSYTTDGYYQWKDVNGGYGNIFYTTTPKPIDGTPVYIASGYPAPAGVASNVSLHTVYTAAGLPYADTRTMPITGDYGFKYTTVQPAMPPAGRFYTMIAQNISATIGGDDVVDINQHQYGTIWHEHWGDDYRGQFAISRITLDQATADAAVVGSYPYKYTVNGGRLYGGVDFKSGKLWQGALVSGGIIMAPGDVEYPITSNDTIGQKSDALYFQYGASKEVWLNVWSGTWPTTYGGPGGTGKYWHTVVHSLCLEGYIPNCYSVQLGWVTPNGAPQQEHKGAISIRGRWA